MSDPVFERIDMLLVDRGKSQQKLLKVLGLNRSTFSNWKKGKCKSYLKHIDEIADFLNVSADYLYRGIETEALENTKTAIEDEMLRVFRTLSLNKQKCMIQVARTLLIEGREENLVGEEVG